IRAAIPEMLKNGGGVIVNTASIDGQVGMATLAQYCAAKHGVIGLTKVCGLEYGSRNIRCVAVAPGYVETNMVAGVFTEAETAGLLAMTPLQRACEPREVAELVAWLASSKASYVNGSVHTIDGGLTAGFVDMRPA
ncbi:MAG: SDR family oxidoreductase, partial [Beijerinckiaceae bacterium]|nr:SDR family oxidoreductase [Beijerinckiaceae bacterium]